MLLATEEDWPTAFEAVLGRLGPLRHGGETHELGRRADPERAVRPALDSPRYTLVIDRLSWWYDLPREWLKKIALMDDVYLLNNPFTFQAMEKHAAYCAMMRLGLHVPETWLLPHRLPPDNPRYVPMAERYNPEFDLEAIGERVGYPLYMKPFDGGMWVGVTRIAGPEELHAAYDASGERLMHLQASVEDYDVFTRSLSIGPQTRVMRYDPGAHGHYRYQLDRDFLAARAGARGGADQPARERVLPLGVQLLRDDRQGRPGAPDRLRERLARHRARQPPLLLPLGDPLARRLVRVLLGDRPLDAPEPADARVLRRRRRRRASPTRRSSPATRSSRTPTSRPTSSRSSAPRRSPTSTSSSVDYVESAEFDDLVVTRDPARGRARAAGGDDRALPRPHARSGRPTSGRPR